MANIKHPRDSRIGVKIYALINPLTGNPYYVGQTGLALRTRLLGHLSVIKVETTKSLVDKGHKPEIFELDFLPADTSPDKAFMEGYWIQQLRAWGFTLDNKYFHNYSENKECKAKMNEGKGPLAKRRIKMEDFAKAMKYKIGRGLDLTKRESLQLASIQKYLTA